MPSLPPSPSHSLSGRRRTAPVLLAALLSLPAPALHAGEEPVAVAFTGVTVIPMDEERRLPGQTVLVEGRRIVAMGPAGEVELPAAVQRVDGRDRFLLPGLSEMHGHLPGRATLERWGEGYMDRVLVLNAANGVTTLRGMLGDPLHLEVRAEVARGERLGLQLFLAGPSLNGDTVPHSEAARRAVTEQRAAGYDLLKIHPGVPLGAFDELARIAARERIPFAGHIPAGVGLVHALEAGIATVEHLDGYLETLVPADAPEAPGGFFFGFHLVDLVDEELIPAIVERTVEAGAWNTPTQMLFLNLFGEEGPEELARRPEMRYVPAAMVEQWEEGARQRFGQGGTFTPERGRRYLEIRRRLLTALHQAGAGILLGADAPQIFNVPGFATLRELEALVAAGLSPFEALAAGTRNPARYLGLEESFGTVAEGMRADLVLLEADPLVDVAAVRQLAGVMLAGRWLPRAELQELLAALEE